MGTPKKIERFDDRPAHAVDRAILSMTRLFLELDRLAPLMVWSAVAFAVVMVAAVVLERAAFGWRQTRSRYLAQRYGPLVQRALDGDEVARRQLLASPARHRIAIAWLLIAPLIEDRDPARIAATRAIAQAMSVLPLADRYLRSRLWWRRALALRALGLIQARDYTDLLVDALDDSQPDVRAAALDGLTDMHDPSAVPAIVLRLHDTSLHRGRRGAALKAFGSTLRAVPAGAVRGRLGTPPQLHTRARHLWHFPVAAGSVPLDPRPSRRGTRRGIRGARVRGARRRCRACRHRGVGERRPAGQGDGRLRAARLAGPRRRGRPSRAASRRHVGGRRPGRAHASVDG